MLGVQEIRNEFEDLLDLLELFGVLHRVFVIQKRNLIVLDGLKVPHFFSAYIFPQFPGQMEVI